MKKFLSILLAAAMIFCLAACSNTGKKEEDSSEDASQTVKSGVEDGVLTIAMECAYKPYNWTQTDDSNGAVPIKGTNEFANGYDIIMAKKICEANNWELEVKRLDWDSLVPAVQTGQVDAVIAGQSMTAKRMQQVDFAGPYLYATIVCLTKKDSKFATAKGISDLAGGKCTSQSSTIWYDTCLPQITGATVEAAKESAPAMLMALQTGDVDFVCTDKPTAQAALIAYPDMVMLDFAGSDDNFKVDQGDINIGISVMKGNTVLKDAINSVLDDYTEASFNEIMKQATKIQPVTNAETSTTD